MPARHLHYCSVFFTAGGDTTKNDGARNPKQTHRYWKESGVEKSDEFVFLTNVIHTEWAGLSAKEHKGLKNLKTQNLRDHMSEAELIFTALAELSTRQIAETEKAKGLQQNAVAGKKGGKIAKDARLALEQKTGRKVKTFCRHQNKKRN